MKKNIDESVIKNYFSTHNLKITVCVRKKVRLTDVLTALGDEFGIRLLWELKIAGPVTIGELARRMDDPYDWIRLRLKEMERILLVRKINNRPATYEFNTKILEVPVIVKLLQVRK